MQLLIQYHQLYVNLSSDSVKEEIPVTLEQLANVLYCSLRNVRFILKKMEHAGWICWTAGRGRGNRSQLTLLVSADELIVREMKSLLARGNIKAAMELIRLPDVGEAAKAYFAGWMTDHFGYEELHEDGKKLDILRFPVPRKITTLNPVEVQYAIDQSLVNHIFDTLVRYDPQKRTVLPHIAYHWEVNEERTLWTLYLRKGIRFHSGKELQARDVAYSLSRSKHRFDLPSSWLFNLICELRIFDPYALQIQLRSPNYLFLRFLASSEMAIVPEAERGGEEAGTWKPIGTGPYRVKHYDEYNCVLEAFPDYFLGRSQLDRIDIWAVPEEISISEQTKKEMHLLVSHGNRNIIPPSADWKAESRLETGCNLLTFNMKKPGPHQHPCFRQAVHHAIDRDGMAAYIGGERPAFPAQGFLAQAEEGGEDPAFDRELAKVLLRSADYKGETLQLHLTAWHEPSGRWLQRQCAEAGIQIEIVVLPVAEMFRSDRLREADLSLFGIVAWEDIDLSFLDMYQSPSSIRAHLSEPLMRKLDRLADKILQEPEHSGRVRNIQRIESLIRDSHEVLFLLHRTQQIMFNPMMRGVRLNPNGWIDFTKVWFQPGMKEPWIYYSEESQ